MRVTRSLPPQLQHIQSQFLSSLLLFFEQVYEDRVAYLNGMMVKTHAIKPVGKAFSFAKIGSLPEDNAFASEEQRRNAVIRKLKAEEVRSKLKVRIPFSNK